MVTPLQASFNTLLEEFLAKNIDLKNRAVDVDLAKLQYQSLLIMKGLQLNFLGSRDDNQLDTASIISPTKSKNTIYSLGISKSFFSGTTLALSNGLINIDRSAVLSGSPVLINEFSQEVKLTQKLGKNFLGRIEKSGLEQGEQNISLQKIAKSEYQDQKVQEFYSKYLQVLQNSENTMLQEKAYKRAVARTKLVKRKWKDGLAEKVEVLQAHNAQMTQKEQLQTFKMNTSATVAELESMLHRSIKIKEINVIDLEHHKVPSLPTGTLEGSSAFQKIEKQLALDKLKLTQSSYGIRPDVEFSASYKTNSYQADRFDAISNGYLGKGQRDLQVAISVTSQWDFAAEKNSLAQQQIAKQKSEYALSKISKNFSFQVDSFKREFKLLKNNIALAKERLVISKRVLQEYTRLYRVGKSDLDQLIRAEESLITTEKSLLNYYISYEQKTVSLASLYGHVVEYLQRRVFKKGAAIEKHN